jgi:hypothetical protein
MYHFIQAVTLLNYLTDLRSLTMNKQLHEYLEQFKQIGSASNFP